MTVDQLEEPVEYEGRSLQELVVLTKKGDFAAKYEIGRRFLHGTGGAKQDYPFALQMITPVAHKGYPQAQYTLGLMYGKGLGTEQDTEKAAEWYKKAALQGHSQAKLRLEEWIPSGRKEAPTPHEESRYLGENEDNDRFSMEDFEYVDDESENEDIEIIDDEVDIRKDPVLYRTRAIVEALSGNYEDARREANIAVKYSGGSVEYKRFKLSLLLNKDFYKCSEKIIEIFNRIYDSNEEWKGSGFYYVPLFVLRGLIVSFLILSAGFPPILVPVIMIGFIYAGYNQNYLLYKSYIRGKPSYDVIGFELRSKWRQMVSEEGEEQAKVHLLKAMEEDVRKKTKEEKIRKMKENINRAVAGNPMVHKAIWQLLEGIVRSIFR